jgi:peptidoglycan/xylan/chitin deacetylase (PgdA/CDA1 family)
VLLLLVEAGAGLALSAGAPAGARALHLSSACSNNKSIALTFDDGPNPPYTEQILAMLASHHVRATFFDEGEAVEAQPDTVRAEVAAQMAVGAHSWSHSDKLPSLPADEFARDTSMAGASISRVAGYLPALYRAPYGHTSSTMLRELHKLGYVSIGWDVDSRDWSDATADEIVRNVLSNAHPGAIVLMHDGALGGGDPDRSKTIEALPRIIDGLQHDGYALVTVPEATGVRLAQPASRTEGLRCSAN